MHQCWHALVFLTITWYVVVYNGYTWNPCSDSGLGYSTCFAVDPHEVPPEVKVFESKDALIAHFNSKGTAHVRQVYAVQENYLAGEPPIILPLQIQPSYDVVPQQR